MTSTVTKIENDNGSEFVGDQLLDEVRDFKSE